MDDEDGHKVPYASVPLDVAGNLARMELHAVRMFLSNPNLFVISGGPGSGKTAVLTELAKLGFPNAPEVARQIIQEQMKTGGTALPWEDREAYTQLMLQRSIESYLEHTPVLKPMFSDRGIPDTLCYARLIRLREQGFIQTACLAYRYAPVVLLAPPWEEIYRTDSERTQDFAEVERTFQHITEVYRQYGYELVELPKLPPPSRAQFILDRLGLTPRREAKLPRSNL